MSGGGAYSEIAISGNFPTRDHPILVWPLNEKPSPSGLTTELLRPRVSRFVSQTHCIAIDRVASQIWAGLKQWGVKGLILNSEGSCFRGCPHRLSHARLSRRSFLLPCSAPGARQTVVCLVTRMSLRHVLSLISAPPGSPSAQTPELALREPLSDSSASWATSPAPGTSPWGDGQFWWAVLQMDPLSRR